MDRRALKDTDGACVDPCGECYKGINAFSEKETQTMRDFIDSHKEQLKFVVNLHSNGNSWIYPYNGRATNDIETRNPGMLQIFQEIAKDATFPQGNQHQGNSKTIIGDQIGGDMDDWILSTYNIPAVTGEIGDESDFRDEWTVNSADKAYEIISSNQPWLEHTYLKLGSQLKMAPSKYKVAKEKG